MESTKPTSDFTYNEVDAVNNKLNTIDIICFYGEITAKPSLFVFLVWHHSASVISSQAEFIISKIPLNALTTALL